MFLAKIKEEDSLLWEYCVVRGTNCFEKYFVTLDISVITPSFGFHICKIREIIIASSHQNIQSVQKCTNTIHFK